MADTPRFGWGHVNINVSNLDRSIEFYRKLGFEEFLAGIPYLNLQKAGEARRLPDGAADALGISTRSRGRACIMQLDSGFPKIDLTELDDKQQEAPLRNSDLGLVRICLISRDLQQDVARLEAQGVEFLSAPQPGQDGMADIAVCADPDGTLIELLQVYLDRWPVIPGSSG